MQVFSVVLPFVFAAPALAGGGGDRLRRSAVLERDLARAGPSSERISHQCQPSSVSGSTAEKRKRVIQQDEPAPGDQSEEKRRRTATGIEFLITKNSAKQNYVSDSGGSSSSSSHDRVRTYVGPPCSVPEPLPQADSGVAVPAPQRADSREDEAWPRGVEEQLQVQVQDTPAVVCPESPIASDSGFHDGRSSSSSKGSCPSPATPSDAVPGGPRAQQAGSVTEPSRAGSRGNACTGEAEAGGFGAGSAASDPKDVSGSEGAVPAPRAQQADSVTEPSRAGSRGNPYTGEAEAGGFRAGSADSDPKGVSGSEGAVPAPRAQQADSVTEPSRAGPRGNPYTGEDAPGDRVAPAPPPHPLVQRDPDMMLLKKVEIAADADHRSGSGADTVELVPAASEIRPNDIVLLYLASSSHPRRLTSELRKYLDRFMFDTVKIPLNADLECEEAIAGGSGERDPAGRGVEHKIPRHQRDRPVMDEICGEPPLTERQLRSRHSTVGMRPRVKVLYSHVSARSTTPKARPVGVDPLGPPHTDQLGAAERARVRAEWKAWSDAVRSMPMEWLALPFFEPLSAPDVPEQEPDEYPTRTRLSDKILRVFRALGLKGRHFPLLYSVYQSPWSPEGAVGKVEVKQFCWHPDAGENFYETFPRFVTTAETKWRWAMESYASRVRAATISGGEQGQAAMQSSGPGLQLIRPENNHHRHHAAAAIGGTSWGSAFAGSQRTQELEAPDGFISSMPELHSHLQPNDLVVLYFQPEVQEHSLLVSRAEPRGSQLAGDGFFMRDHVAAFERILQRAVDEVKAGEIFRRRMETQAVVQGLARASPRPVMLSDFNVRVVYVGRGRLSRAFFRRYCEERGWLAAREELFATRRLGQWWRADLQYYFVVPLVLVDEHLTAQMTRADLFSLYNMASELDKAFLMAVGEEESNGNKNEFLRYSPGGVEATAHGG